MQGGVIRSGGFRTISGENPVVISHGAVSGDYWSAVDLGFRVVLYVK